jgi:hypothetical protein
MDINELTYTINSAIANACPVKCEAYLTGAGSGKSLCLSAWVCGENWVFEL